MRCISILPSLRRCNNYACTDKDTCSSHKDYTKELHLSRWTEKYFRIDLFNYDWDKHIGEELLWDIEAGWITINDYLISSLPAHMMYADLFTFLCEKGYAMKEWNIPLWKACIRLILQRIFIGAEVAAGMNERHWDRNRPIENTFIHSSGENLLHTLEVLPSILREKYFEKYFENNPQIICDWIISFVDSRATRELSWNKQRNSALLDIYKTSLGNLNPLSQFIENTWIPYVNNLCNVEKTIQLQKIQPLKQDLMNTTVNNDENI